MNGFLVINKPINYTSRDVVNKVSKLLNTKKVGHTGTLDPIATGILILTIGSATKLLELITDYDKEYIATFKLGIETDTLDITGNITNSSNNKITNDQLIRVIEKYKGNIVQEVPKYSAVKVNGKKLYEYARNNIEVELPKRNITIYELELLENNEEIKIRCLVSKGTYIRSLIRDIGRDLGTFATMTSLVRTKQGGFNLSDSVNLDDIENKIISIEDYFSDKVKIDLDDDQYKKVINGNKIENIYNIKDDYFYLYYNNQLIAIYMIDNNDSNVIKPYKMIKTTIDNL